MSRLLPLTVFLIGLVAGAAYAADVFQWVDEDGTVHYSDRPLEGQENAESIELPEAQTFTLPPVATPRQTSNSASGAANGFSYTELGIVNPTPDETLWSTGGEVEVSLELSPRLRPNHKLRLYLDNQLVEGQATGNLQIKLTEVYRGTHALLAEVQDANGKSLIKSPPVTFTVKQTSILNPNNPNNIPGPGPAG